MVTTNANKLHGNTSFSSVIEHNERSIRESIMDSIDYSKVVVKKPWGHEYLCYSNGDVAVWYLFIKKGERTSMHCHPSKNTGLVLLEGEVELSFIRNKVEMKGLDKIHIFRARFHSSYAQTDSYLFEVEAPEDKEEAKRRRGCRGRKTRSGKTHRRD